MQTLTESLELARETLLSRDEFPQSASLTIRLRLSWRTVR